MKIDIERLAIFKAIFFAIILAAGLFAYARLFFALLDYLYGAGFPLFKAWCVVMFAFLVGWIASALRRPLLKQMKLNTTSGAGEGVGG